MEHSRGLATTSWVTLAMTCGSGIADHTCLPCHTWFSPSPCGADIALVFNQLSTWAWRAWGVSDGPCPVLPPTAQKGF